MTNAPQSMDYAELDRSFGAVDMPNVQIGDYQMFGYRDDLDVFAEFYINGGKSIPESDWKAHISILATELEKAWDIIHPLLVEARVHHFKIARQSACRAKANALASGTYGTAHQVGQGLADLGRIALGMQVTVYIAEGLEVKIRGLLKTIEARLAKAKISPGVIDVSDRKLGRYCSVRNDGGATAYVSHDKASGYNPSGAQDPFKSF